MGWIESQGDLISTLVKTRGPITLNSKFSLLPYMETESYAILTFLKPIFTS